MDEDADYERSALAAILFCASALVALRGTGKFVRVALTCCLGPGLMGLSALSAQESGVAPPVTAREGVVLSRSLVGDRTQVRAAIHRGLDYLRRQPTAAVGKKYKVAVTSLAGLAVLGAGYQPRQGEYSTLLSNCVKYLRSVEQDGYMTEQDEASRMHGHCYAVLFLTQILGSLSPGEEGEVTRLVRRGVHVIERAQSSSGGWYYYRDNRDNRDEASVTVCALQALRAARNIGIPVDSFRIKQAMRYVRDCQGEDGSFAYSSLPRDKGRRTYALSVAALSTLNAAGVYESKELTKGFEYVRRVLSAHRGSPWRAAEREYPYYANLYAAQTLYQDGGDLWKSWYPKVTRYLLSKQKEDDGSWESNYGLEYGTAFALLILEVPLGYLPIFQR